MLDYDYQTTRPDGAEFAPLRFVSGFLFSGDSGTVYRSLIPPVWVVHGTRGDFVDYRGLQQMKDLPSWSIDVLPTGAMPHFESPDEFFRLYDTWLERLPTNPTPLKARMTGAVRGPGRR